VPTRGLPDVWLDLCTQRDYLSPDGARPVLNVREILPNIKHLMALARWAKLPTLSCVDGCRPEAVRGIPRPCCVLGTLGQRKIHFSLLPDHVWIDGDNHLCVPLDVLQQHQQVILLKQHRDPFTNPKLDRLLTEMSVRRFYVFGVALEVSVRLLVLGLLLRNRRVTLVRDACGYFHAGEADMALRQLAAKGCEILPTAEVVRKKLIELSRRRGNGLNHRRFVA